MERSELELAVLQMRRNELVKSLMDAMSEGVFIIDEAARLLYANKRSQEITGYRESELLGKNVIGELVIPEQQALVAMHFQTRLKGETGAYETVIVLKDGTKKVVRISAAPIRSPGHKTIASIAILTENPPG